MKRNRFALPWDHGENQSIRHLIDYKAYTGYRFDYRLIIQNIGCAVGTSSPIYQVVLDIGSTLNFTIRPDHMWSFDFALKRAEDYVKDNDYIPIKSEKLMVMI